MTKQEKRFGDTLCDLWEFFGADPFKGRFPPPLFCHMDFLYELQAPQDISYIIESTHFGCKHTNRQKDYLLPEKNHRTYSDKTHFPQQLHEKYVYPLEYLNSLHYHSFFKSQVTGLVILQ